MEQIEVIFSFIHDFLCVKCGERRCSNDDSKPAYKIAINAPLSINIKFP